MRLFGGVLTDSKNRLIRSIDRKTRRVTTLAGNGSADNVDGIGTAARFHNPAALTYSNDEHALYIGCNGAIRRLNLNTKEVTTIDTAVKHRNVWGIAVLSSGMLV